MPSDTSTLKEDDLNNFPVWIHREMENYARQGESPGSPKELNLLAYWHRERPKMCRELGLELTKNLTFVLVQKEHEAVVRYLKAGWPASDAEEQAAKEWLLHEPESDPPSAEASLSAPAELPAVTASQPHSRLSDAGKRQAYREALMLVGTDLRAKRRPDVRPPPFGSADNSRLSAEPRENSPHKGTSGYIEREGSIAEVGHRSAEISLGRGCLRRTPCPALVGRILLGSTRGAVRRRHSDRLYELRVDRGRIRRAVTGAC